MREALYGILRHTFATTTPIKIVTDNSVRSSFRSGPDTVVA